MNDTMNLWQSKRIQTILFWLLVVCALFVAIKTINEFKHSSYIGRDVPLQNVITVSGTGEAFAKPDTATFNFTIEEEAVTVADAQKKVDQKVNDALAYLKKSGVAEKDIKTVSYQIYPKYEYQMPVCNQFTCAPQKEPKIIGYKVSQMTEVKVRDLEKAGELLTGIGAVNVTNLSGLTFEIDDQDGIKTEARTEAIQKAQTKAEALADELGVSLVRIVSFSESGDYPIYYGKGGGVAYDAAVTPTSATVAPGETKITSNVSITYEIR